MLNGFPPKNDMFAKSCDDISNLECMMFDLYRCLGCHGNDAQLYILLRDVMIWVFTF